MENRTIKFRAWIPTGFDDDDNPTGFKMIDDLAFEEYLPLNDHLRNFESPLMQFTGLYDKNGREIYEGDILRLNYKYRGGDDEDLSIRPIIVQIDFHGGSFWFTGDGYTDCNWHFYNALDRKVIGNIYENPRLLKGD